jgi:hypothetical protein
MIYSLIFILMLVLILMSMLLMPMLLMLVLSALMFSMPVLLTLVLLTPMLSTLILLTLMLILMPIFINYKARSCTFEDEYIIPIIDRDLVRLDLKEDIVMLVGNIVNSLRASKLLLS